MGEIHKASLEGVKLEGAFKEHAPIIAFFFGFWFTLFVAFQQKDDKVKSAVLKGAIFQFLATWLCYVGWIWAIMWAIAAKKQS